MVDFAYPTNPNKSAIVNTTNKRCLGGRGADGAISRAGGDDLLCDRQALPVIHSNPNSAKAVRCMMGNAAITGSNSYGQLRMPFFIHAVSPNYSRGEYKYSEETGDIKLKKIYSASMACDKEKVEESITFSLLSARVFWGNRTIHEVLNIGIQTIIACRYEGLREVHLCGYSQDECFALIEVAQDLGLTREVGT